MEDPGSGGKRPSSGALRPGDPSGDGDARRRGDDSWPARSLSSGHEAGQDAPLEKHRTRKRRRKRGRKVFARDRMPLRGAHPDTMPDRAVAAGPNGAAATIASPAPGKRPAAGSVSRVIVQPRPERGLRDGAADPVYAALDLGTNNCRLLVAVPTRPGRFRVIDAFSRIVRLGEGLAASGRLGERAMDRAVEALAVCADKLRQRQVRRSRLIATEACRSAENGALFLERVARETGLTLEIIDRRTEARLAVSGCGSLVERDTHGVVLFDIGGGSSEIALIDLSGHRTARLANHIVAWTSLPVGVVSLAERFGGRHVTRDVFDAMVAEVAALLAGFGERRRLDHLARGTRFHLLGTSGTVTTLAGLHLGLERYDRRRVDGLWMDGSEVDRMIDRLLGWEFEERVANACIGADRADLVLAGCAILEAIRAAWPSDRLRVADRGLREGILSELMADDGVWRRRGPAGW